MLAGLLGVGFDEVVRDRLDAGAVTFDRGFPLDLAHQRRQTAPEPAALGKLAHAATFSCGSRAMSSRASAI